MPYYVDTPFRIRTRKGFDSKGEVWQARSEYFVSPEEVNSEEEQSGWYEIITSQGRTKKEALADVFERTARRALSRWSEWQEEADPYGYLEPVARKEKKRRC